MTGLGSDAAGFVLANSTIGAAPLVPEVRLRLADEPFELWERAGTTLPYWAFAWAGGQALARYVLDHPEVVAGRSVLDVASGSGLVAIAAALAGAASVTATDIDPLAIAAIAVNATANGATVRAREADVLTGSGEGADVVLAGDVCYDRAMAAHVLPFTARAAAAGALTLLGDPGRAHFEAAGFRSVATYPVPVTATLEATDVTRTTVWQRAS